MIVAAEHVWFWQTPSWNWAELWALAILLIVSFVPVDVETKTEEKVERGTTKRTVLLVALVNGRDGRWSTSKTSAILWTYAVWFAFITILLHTNGQGLSGAVLHQQYLVLMGLPVAAAVVAKGMTQSKVESGKLATKLNNGTETNVASGLGQLVSDDSGQPDLLDFQYFGFNVILLGYFFTRFLGNQSLGLPDLPDTLVALSGVSAAGYLGKKGLEQDTTPVITSVTPRTARPGEVITIAGVNLATKDDKDVSLRIGEVAVRPNDVSIHDATTKLDVTIPAQAAPGAAPVRVINHRGVESDPYEIAIG
jgi:hypothetical protein